MSDDSHRDRNPDRELARRHHEQMLKLVARSFYREMINYGVAGPDVLSVAGHLLDNVMHFENTAGSETSASRHSFTVRDVVDGWKKGKKLQLGDVWLAPLEEGGMADVLGWLRSPSIRGTFHPPFPESDRELRRSFGDSRREYFLIGFQSTPAGIIGAEDLDTSAAKLEMRKLIGDPAMHGKGIGKRATFLFLYHTFLIRQFEKIYVHSMDTNIRNLNLNRKFGFELEGVFFQEVMVGHERRDVVRMGLLRSVWLSLFSGTAS